MHWKLATRLNSFRLREGRKLSSSAALEAVSRVKGISAVELNYPQHFHEEKTDLLAHARQLGLAITALNLRFDGPDYAHGAFAHPSKDHRQRAIRLCCDAVSLAAEHKIPHVILWMGPDGWDYPFQCDYAALWQESMAAFRQVADAAPHLQVSVEYKPWDPRRYALIRNMGEALLAVRQVDRKNFGVTLDYCHLLMAGENPAFAAALALAEGKLFGVHLNDGYGKADDGLVVGSVTEWQTLELLWELRQGKFDGTIYFDTFPDRLDPAVECAANVAAIARFESILDRVEANALALARTAQDPLAAMAVFRKAVDAR